MNTTCVDRLDGALGEQDPRLVVNLGDGAVGAVVLSLEFAAADWLVHDWYY